MQPDPPNMSKRNLLICFDAFGTLFTPKRSIAQQYGDVARSFGLEGFGDEEIGGSFRKGEVWLNSTALGDGVLMADVFTCM